MKLQNIEIANAISQTVAAEGSLALGTITRRFTCGCNPAFEYTSPTSLTLLTSGYYLITYNTTFTSGTAGNISFVIETNGVAVPQSATTETITTATTEIRSVSATTIVRVLPNAPLYVSVVSPSGATISLVNLVVEKII